LWGFAPRRGWAESELSLRGERNPKTRKKKPANSSASLGVVFRVVTLSNQQTTEDIGRPTTNHNKKGERQKQGEWEVKEVIVLVDVIRERQLSRN